MPEYRVPNLESAGKPSRVSKMVTIVQAVLHASQKLQVMQKSPSIAAQMPEAQS